MVAQSQLSEFDVVQQAKRSAQHTYGMAVTNREVIDARCVGGVARFANHSCSPNCTVERWEVGGETCCGLFAKQDISQGEEITISFGNQFVRPEVSLLLLIDQRTYRLIGLCLQQRKQCLCAATNCTGFM
jgi:SET domain-containing protein